MQLSKLKERVEREPSPASIGELVRFHIHNGDYDGALSVVDKGLKSYPDSETLKEFSAYLLKSRSVGKLKAVREALELDPTPKDYVQAIDLYQQQGDLQTAMEYGQALLKEFPQSVLAHRTIGELRMTRFREDFAAKDGKAAERSFLAALELDPEDLSSHLQLARLYFCCGLVQRTRVHLEKILATSPRHGEAVEMMRVMDDIEDQEEDLDIRLLEVEERGGGYNDLDSPAREDAQPLGEHNREKMEETLQCSVQLEGVVASVFIGHGGDRFGFSRSGTDWEPFCRYVSRVDKAVQKASLRMDIGAFEKIEMEGVDGAILLRNVREGTLAFLFEDRRRLGKSVPVLKNLIDEATVVIGKSDG